MNDGYQDVVARVDRETVDVLERFLSVAEDVGGVIPLIRSGWTRGDVESVVINRQLDAFINTVHQAINERNMHIVDPDHRCEIRFTRDALVAGSAVASSIKLAATFGPHVDTFRKITEDESAVAEVVHQIMIQLMLLQETLARSGALLTGHPSMSLN